MMDNRAQISIEYLVIVSVLIIITAVIAVLGFNLFGLKESIKNHAEAFINETLEMIG